VAGDGLSADARRRLAFAGGVAIVLAIVVVAVALTAGGGSSGDSAGSGASARSSSSAAPGTTAAAGPAAAALPGAQTGRPPWTNGGTGLAARLQAIGLPALPEEGTVLHIHQHLDLFVNGRRVRVPAGIGIDAQLQFISPLHTHDTTGTLHVESPQSATFTLGQFFEVWGVPLSARRLGGLRVGRGRVLREWVNGRPLSGDPAATKLASHQEIVLAYGTPAQMPKRPPASFEFAPGE
jgi:hypothetical protein